ncbi:hypothetical protein [Candidatus Villigracilis saccharophilus]|uniref:hypothetical protein n=1 Tax=Candidatus Villigracilis saccharophilus TaxID=3140684 RepID=UPI0031359160|nr:hypothetical protein [Anaerolineales bacterium]
MDSTNPIVNCFESLNSRAKVGSCAVNPLDTQFFIYMGNLIQGDLMISFHTNRPVSDILFRASMEYGPLIGAGADPCDHDRYFLWHVLSLEGAHLAGLFILNLSLVAWSIHIWLGGDLLYFGKQPRHADRWHVDPGHVLLPPLLTRWGDIAPHMFLRP